MGKLVDNPEMGDDAATQDVASILAGIVFPIVEPLDASDELLAGLPAWLVFPIPDPEPLSKASVARDVIASGISALSVVRGLENSLAACKAALVVRICSAVTVESAATELTAYQTGLAQSGCVAEIASALSIPERTAAGLATHAQGLHDHPATRTALQAGALSWRHACTVLQELHTLAETPSVTYQEVACFEGELLRLAEGTTASRFAGKARRARESLFPQSLDTRTREAFRSRRITNDPGKDGMNWLTLHLPTLAANAIMVHCTRTARAIKAQAHERQREAQAHDTGEDCREYRTLDQLRADIAAILLMGQKVPATWEQSTDCSAASSQGARSSQGASSWNQRHANTSDSQSDVPGDSSQSVSSGVIVLHDDEPPWAHTTSSRDASTLSSSFSSTLPSEQASAPPPRGTPNSDGGNSDARKDGKEGYAIQSSASRKETGPALDDVPVEGMLVGDGSGWVDGVVDGIGENPQREFLEQLRILGDHQILVDPPLPKALVLVKVPLLGLLGITDEPAQLDDNTAGPIPLALARKLLAGTNTFLRVLTDPVTGQCLPLEPQRYKLRDAERSVLQALAGGCYFPNCANPVQDTELDHVRSFESGGPSTMANLRPACLRHHHLKHFKDDKDRLGHPRRWAEPWRTGIRLNGWTPRPQANGNLVWETPSKTMSHPEYVPEQRPTYPAWLRSQIKNAIRARRKAHRYGQ